MALNIATSLASLIEESESIERESETIYLTLGRLFPALASETAKSASNAEHSIKGLDEVRSSSGGRMALRETEGLAHDSEHFFRFLHERDTAFLEHVNESVERLGSLAETIARVRSDSEEMEIISLNAMTVAFKSGAEGKAFSVITDELKRLSGSTISLTEEVTGRGTYLLESYGTLKLSLGELDLFQREFFSSLHRSLDEGYTDIERSLSAASALFSGLLEEAGGVKAPVHHVMQEVQYQDIVRQSLQHVAISLKEGREEGGAGEGPAFAAAVTELSANLVAEVLTKLSESTSSFHRDISEVRRIVESCEGRRLAFLKESGSSKPVEDQGHKERIAAYLALKRGVIVSSLRLSEQVKGLDESFKKLAAILSRFQNIVVSSRIEVAKTRALAGVATTVQGMIQLTGRIESDVGGAMETTKAVIRGASAAIGEYSSGGEDERLSATLRVIDGDVARLRDLDSAVRSAIHDFSLYTPKFIALIGEGERQLEAMRCLSTRLSAVRDELRSFNDRLRADLPKGAQVRSERLRSMVERFTIFTHKKVAAEIGSFEVEEGVEAGEVTLF